MRVIRFIAWTVVWLVAFVWLIWAFGAVYFDFPLISLRWVLAAALPVIVIAAVIFLRGKGAKLMGVVGILGLITAWWLTLQPTNNRDWQPDVARTAWAEMNGDEVIVHDVRNCDYQTETDFTPRWETRTVRLSQLKGIDMAITYWGSPLIAHPIVSFRFADSPPLCFSIETRKAAGQTYSAIRGLYRQFTLIYIAADERDVIRLRTNYRRGEEVYLYRTLISPARARERFLEYFKTLNKIHTRPRWYNAITTNCTTSIRDQHPANERIPWDWRILANGKGDELLYEHRLIDTGGLPFPELKERSHINQKAHDADQDADFSRRIREDLPGFATQ